MKNTKVQSEIDSQRNESKQKNYYLEYWVVQQAQRKSANEIKRSYYKWQNNILMDLIINKMFQLYAGTMLFFLYVPRCVCWLPVCADSFVKQNLSHENTFFLSSQGIHLNLYDFIVQFILIFNKKWISISIQLRKKTKSHWIETKRKKKI